MDELTVYKVMWGKLHAETVTSQEVDVWLAAGWTLTPAEAWQKFSHL